LSLARSTVFCLAMTATCRLSFVGLSIFFVSYSTYTSRRNFFSHTHSVKLAHVKSDPSRYKPITKQPTSLKDPKHKMTQSTERTKAHKVPQYYSTVVCIGSKCILISVFAFLVWFKQNTVHKNSNKYVLSHCGET
jgi:hypothetical protein